MQLRECQDVSRAHVAQSQHQHSQLLVAGRGEQPNGGHNLTQTFYVVIQGEAA